MSKMKTFIIGVIFGSFLVGGVGYAADQLHIEVDFPDIPYWYDGKELNLGDEDKTILNDGEMAPTTIRYKGTNYVPIRDIAEALDKEVDWDPATGRVLILSNEELEFEEINHDDTNAEVKEWVTRSLNKELAQVKIVGETTYILLTLGEKNTGGYEIDINEIKQYYDGVKAVVDLVEPDKGDFVIEEVTHPYKLVRLVDPYQGPVQFEEVSGKVIPIIQGVSEISSKYKESETILLFDPEITEDGVNIRGVVNTFEGVINYSLVDADDNVVENNSIQSLGANPNWGYFEQEIPKKTIEQDNSLILHTDFENDGISEDMLKVDLSSLINLE